MRKNLPLLSVITPVYNREALLKKCFDSLYRQTETDFEWIVVDDGSTDSTPEVMKNIMDMEKTFPVIYVRNTNGGKEYE